MIRISRNSSYVITVVCALLAAHIVGCSEDSDEGDMEKLTISGAPPLPPDESMTVDLSLFDEKVLGSPVAAPVLSSKHYMTAATAAAGISSAVVASISLPAALFRSAKGGEPEQQNDGSWLWTFSQQIESFTFTARLTGTTEGNTTVWSMKVSSDMPIYPVEDFEWYTGTTVETNTLGSWQLYDVSTPKQRNPTVKVDWSVAVLKLEANLTLENVDKRSNKYQGDTLEYETDMKTVSMLFKDASENRASRITWDVATGAGSIAAPGYNNGEEGCWDAQKQDVQCK